MTNGVLSALLFVYPQNAIQWSSHSQFSAVIGYNAGDYENFYNHPDSETVEIFDIGQKIGNTGERGKWFFRVDGTSNQFSSSQECLNWYLHEPDPPAYLYPCPCTYEQALIDATFQVQFGSYCGSRRFSLADGSGQRCCYSLPPSGLSFLYGSYLLSGVPDGSHYTRYHFSSYKMYEANDILPYHKCCLESSYCHLYSEKRPLLTCQDYIAPDIGTCCFVCTKTLFY